MLVGYAMYYTREKGVKVNKILAAAMWILSISVMLLVIFVYLPFQQIINNTTTRTANALFLSSYRIVWSITMAWVIFACHNGSGGIIRWFLSLRQWQPIARMGLSIYLVHRVYEMATIMPKKQTIYFDYATVVSYTRIIFDNLLV